MRPAPDEKKADAIVDQSGHRLSPGDEGSIEKSPSFKKPMESIRLQFVRNLTPWDRLKIRQIG